MTSISTKIMEAFRKSLKSDAVPRDPRPLPRETPDDVTGETHDHTLHTDENEYTTNDQEEIFIEPEKAKKDKKPKKQKDKEDKEKPINSKKNGAKNFNVNTQAAGNVINIIESPGFRWGHDFVYYLGPTQHKTKSTDNDDPEEEHIEKTNEINLLMEATITPEHVYIEYISKNLGKNWHRFFRKLGYTKGRIETFEIDESRNGVSEARYQLLLDWIRNEDDATLGRLSTLLWTTGERHIVKELSIIYCSNDKK